jgi:hypothetical protein
MEAVQLELDLDLPEAPRPAPPVEVIVDQNRSKLLRALYERDNRDDPGHRHCGTFTGLAQAFHQEVGRAVVNALMESPEFTPEPLFDLGRLPTTGSGATTGECR